MSIRVKYPDYILWHQLYAEICEKYPTFKSNPALNETNEMHKFFSVNINKLSRQSDIHNKFSNSTQIMKLPNMNPVQLQKLLICQHP